MFKWFWTIFSLGAPAPLTLRNELTENLIYFSFWLSCPPWTNLSILLFFFISFTPFAINIAESVWMTMILASARIDFKNIYSKCLKPTYGINPRDFYNSLATWMPHDQFWLWGVIHRDSGESVAQPHHFQTSSNSPSNINDLGICVQEKSIFEVWDETCLSLLKSTVAFSHPTFSLTIMVQGRHDAR